jgi:hypothetical protein
VVQYFHDVAEHFLADASDEGGALWRDADHHFAAVISRGRAHHIAKVLQTRYETARRSRGVPHFLRDLRHREHFLAVEIRKKEKLGERNVARREFLAQVQHKTALHFQNDVGKPFGIRTNVIGRSSCKRGNRSRVQREKARMRASAVKPELTGELTNPRFEHQRFDLLSTIDRLRPAATHLPGSNQKVRGIPDDRPA